MEGMDMKWTGKIQISFIAETREEAEAMIKMARDAVDEGKITGIKSEIGERGSKRTTTSE